MGINIPTLLLGLAVRWLIYTGLLWAMIKIQKLNYNLPGLLASSLVATALNLVPLVGFYLSYAVLLLCLWKCTGADIVPDVMFTVVIAGALMFCVNLWVIGALMGDLRVNASEIPGFNKLAATTNDTETAEAIFNSTNTPSQPTAVEPAKPSKDFVLKGVSLHPTHPSALVEVNHKTYTFVAGETVQVQSTEGAMTVRCEEVSPVAVILSLANGERIELGMQ